MNDPQGLQNLVGSGITQLLSSVVTALASLTVPLYLNVPLTIVTLALLLVFAVSSSRNRQIDDSLYPLIRSILPLASLKWSRGGRDRTGPRASSSRME